MLNFSKSFKVVLVFGSLLVAGLAYAADGSNYVNVFSCQNTEKGILIRRDEKDAESLLENGIRDAGHGLRDYALKCVARDRYYVEWREVAPPADEKPATREQPATTTTGLPDFVVKEILLARNKIRPDSGPANVLTVRIKNVGTADVPANSSQGVSVYIWIDDQLEWTYNANTFSDNTFLKVGGTTDVQPQILYGKHRVRSCIDYNQYFKESDESNNCFETTLIGTEEATTTATAECQSPYVPYQGRCVDPVPACENPPANYMSSSCVDKIENGKRIPRYNFQCLKGYTRSGSECVKETTATSTGLPDVVVSINKIDRTSIIYAAQPATWITYTVTNKGDAPTNAPVFLHTISNGSSYNMGYMKVDPLAPGASVSQAFAVGHDSLWPAGKYVVKLEVDYDNKIAESNESNNFSNEQAFTVISQSTTTTPKETTATDAAGMCWNGAKDVSLGELCGKDVYRSARYVCDDGYSDTLGGSTSCKSSETWVQYANEACQERSQYYKCPSTTTTQACQFPYVPYKGQCVDPQPACENPPAGYVHCTDKIENGKRIPRYNLQCGQAFTRSNSECLPASTSTAISKFSFSVTLVSSPRSTNGYANENGYLAAKVGDKIQFKRIIQQSGIVNNAWNWTWDKSKLDCTPYPDFDSPELVCKVVSEGSSVVFITMFPVTEDGAKLNVQSNMIKVYTKSEQAAPLPTTPSRPVPTTQTTAPVAVPVLDTGVAPAGFEDEVMTADVQKNPFSDTDLNTLVGQAAASLHALGIIGGFPDGTFKGNRHVNRAEAAKFLLLSRYSSSALSDLRNESKFWDVLDGQWYTPFIMNAYAKGLMSGYPDGSMGPGRNVNTAEFLKMLSLNFALPLNLPHSYADVPQDAWFTPYAGIAQEYNLFPDRKNMLSPGTELSRAEVAIALYQYLSKR